MIDQLIKDFDQGLKDLDLTDSIYSACQQLHDEINNDVALQALIEKQKELQLIILNFERMKKPGFVRKYQDELEQVDLMLLSDEKLLKLKELKQMIELDKQLIMSELKALNLE